MHAEIAQNRADLTYAFKKAQATPLQCWRFFIVSTFFQSWYFNNHMFKCLNIFAIYVGNASFKCSVRFILNIFIIVWLYLSWKNATCTKFWTGAEVRYYGNWKWCWSYIVCHKPMQFWHLVGNKLYFTIIMTFISIEGKSKSYKHSLIIYWTALVYVYICGRFVARCGLKNILGERLMPAFSGPTFPPIGDRLTMSLWFV